MDDQTLASLDELVEIRHGFAFKGEFFHDDPPGDVLLTPGNFAIGGGFQWGKKKFYRGPVPEDFVLGPGDLVVTMTDLSKDADTLGYPAIIPDTHHRVLHNQRIGRVTSKSTRADKRFIYWLLRTKSYRDEILAGYTGSTVKHTAPRKILAYKFILPRIEDQNKIANVLDSVEAKININRRMNETLEAMARAIFKDWFVDFGPTRAKMEGSAPYLVPEIWSLFPDLLDNAGKPEGWEQSTIGREVDVVGGSTPSTKIASYWGGEYCWATPKDLSSLKAPVLLNTDRKITEAGLSQIGSGLLPSGAVLLSSRAPIGYLVISTIPTAVNQGFIAMICRGRVSNIFAWLWTQANMDAILQNANGSTFQEISKTNFRPIPVIMSPAPLLDEFDRAARPLFERIAANEVEIRTLASTRDLLLPKLMSGEIRVRDAEKIAEAAQ